MLMMSIIKNETYFLLSQMEKPAGGLKLLTHLHLVLHTMHGATSPLSHTSSWCGT